MVPHVAENSRRVWLSDIPCWKSFPANFDAAGQFFTDFPAAPPIPHAHHTTHLRSSIYDMSEQTEPLQGDQESPCRRRPEAHQASRLIKITSRMALHVATLDLPGLANQNTNPPPPYKAKIEHNSGFTPKKGKIGRMWRKLLQRKVSQPQSIIQKGVHTHLLTAREREHWFL